MAYSIETHRHRFAAWAASTAASSSALCRFKVELGLEILQAAGFDESFATPDKLPKPNRVDEVHRRWRKRVITEARKRKIKMTDGVAAKLINCYLKSRFLCGPHFRDRRVQALHPPIDRTLLGVLAEKNVGGLKKEWVEMRTKGWSKYKSPDYSRVLKMMRQSLNGAPLWTIEQYWKGHQ